MVYTNRNGWGFRQLRSATTTLSWNARRICCPFPLARPNWRQTFMQVRTYPGTIAFKYRTPAFKYEPPPRKGVFRLLNVRILKNTYRRLSSFWYSRRRSCVTPGANFSKIGGARQSSCDGTLFTGVFSFQLDMPVTI